MKKGTVFLNTWMYVIRELEDAVDDCQAGCGADGCYNDPVHAWDQAVAFYTGGVPKASGDGGYLLYTLAQKRCRNFGTCLSTGIDVGMAKVNKDIFLNFHEGQSLLLIGECDSARKNVEHISQLMAVPLIQGTIRHAYMMDKKNDNRETTQAEGASYAAAVLPLVHDCNEMDAGIIYDNMRVGNRGSASFEVVKAAFERNYGCMGVQCSDVGGLVDIVNAGYLQWAEPCGLLSPTEANSSIPPNNTITGQETNSISVASRSSAPIPIEAETKSSSPDQQKTIISGVGDGGYGFYSLSTPALVLFVLLYEFC